MAHKKSKNAYNAVMQTSAERGAQPVHKPTSIKDIARMANVSSSTVSRALQNSPLISRRNCRANPAHRQTKRLPCQRHRAWTGDAEDQDDRRRSYDALRIPSSAKWSVGLKIMVTTTATRFS